MVLIDYCATGSGRIHSGSAVVLESFDGWETNKDKEEGDSIMVKAIQ